MESIWRATCDMPKGKDFISGEKADVVIVGAGLCGVLTGYLLQQQGASVVILEQDTIASGVTQNTTAKVTAQHNLIYDKLITQVGVEKAQQYATANREAINAYDQLIREKQIDCDWQRLPAYVYSLDNKVRIEAEVKAAEKLGIPAEFTTETTLPFMVKGAVRFPDQGQFHPLKFLRHLCGELTIFDHTMVRDIEGNTVITDKGNIQADHIIVATHFPFLNAPGYYFARMYQQRSAVIALEQAAQLDGMYIDGDSDSGFSFRNYGDYLLFGGAGYRTGENSLGGSYEKLRRAAKEYYPQSIERYHWSAQDCMSLDGIPYIGEYALNMPHLLVATGFNKWGMTSSMVAAQLFTDHVIKGKSSELAEVFSPQRFHLSASMKNLWQNTMETAKQWIAEKVEIPDTNLAHIPNGHGGIVEYEGKKIGVYKEENGEVHMVTTKCPHLGCQLEWNPDELSWDCPCHGSRFDYRGKLLDNPAMRGLEIEE
ncbi:MAG: FAD-dependent oxidoreductase [Peptococcaceae bacterium]|nr:FAD-dependent oxidoreductase [Peptococcaceae bacterium]